MQKRSSKTVVHYLKKWTALYTAKKKLSAPSLKKLAIASCSAIANDKNAAWSDVHTLHSYINSVVIPAVSSALYGKISALVNRSVFEHVRCGDYEYKFSDVLRHWYSTRHSVLSDVDKDNAIWGYIDGIYLMAEAGSRYWGYCFMHYTDSEPSMYRVSFKLPIRRKDTFVFNSGYLDLKRFAQCIYFEGKDSLYYREYRDSARRIVRVKYSIHKAKVKKQAIKRAYFAMLKQQIHRREGVRYSMLVNYPVLMKLHHAVEGTHNRHRTATFLRARRGAVRAARKCKSDMKQLKKLYHKIKDKKDREGIKERFTSLRDSYSTHMSTIKACNLHIKRIKLFGDYDKYDFVCIRSSIPIQIPEGSIDLHHVGWKAVASNYPMHGVHTTWLYSLRNYGGDKENLHYNIVDIIRGNRNVSTNIDLMVPERYNCDGILALIDRGIFDG